MTTSTARAAYRRGRAHPGRRPAGPWTTAARLAFGGFFLAMAAYNAVVVAPHAADAYRGVAAVAWPGVDRLVLDLVVPWATPLAVALVVFEVGVAVLVLSAGRAVRVGLVAAVVFMIALAPLMSWYELANVPLVALALVLLTREHDRGLLAVLRGSPRP